MKKITIKKTIILTILTIFLLTNIPMALASKQYTMEATAYCTGKLTKSEIPVSRGCVAADWDHVLKPGDVIYIEGYGYGLICDTGGNIKGNRIDVFMETFEECKRFGRRNVKVTVLPRNDYTERLLYEEIKNQIIEGELDRD